MQDFKKLKKLRNELGYTQDQVANMLGVSRVTYNLIENWKVSWNKYREKFEEIFDISFDALERKNKKNINRTLSTKSYQQAKSLILYILKKTADLPNIWKTALYKILYFCEFGWYELYGERLTGMDFVKLPKWPAPAAFSSTIKKMEDEESVVPVNAKYKGYVQQRYLLNERVPSEIFSGKKKAFIDQTIKALKDMNASEISEYSHWDLPWKATKDMELIDIELANSRYYPYSEKINEKRREKDKASFANNPSFAFLKDEEDLYEDLV